MTDSRNNGEKSGKPVPPVEHQFKQGNPGRPKGSRNKLGEAFIAAMHDDFIEHGKTVIEVVRAEKPDQYLKVIASILPKELHVTDASLGDMSDDDLIELARAIRSAKSGAGGSETAGRAGPKADKAGMRSKPSGIH